MPQFNVNTYIDVQERINQFWVDHPDGAIRTRLDSDPSDFTVCRYRAEVYKQRDSDTPDATGYAFETAGGGGANRTSHEENCETSAIGRALANMGYAKDRNDRPSKQEMAKVERGPQSPPPPSDREAKAIGEAMADPPQRATRPQDAPKPAPTAPATPQAAPANLDRERVMKRLHAVSDENGISHDDLHAWAAWNGFRSLSDVPVPRLVEWGQAIKDTPQEFRRDIANVKAQQAELLPTPDQLPDPNRHTHI